MKPTLKISLALAFPFAILISAFFLFEITIKPPHPRAAEVAQLPLLAVRYGQKQPDPKKAEPGRDPLPEKTLDEFRKATAADPLLQDQWLEQAVIVEQGKKRILEWRALHLLTPGETDSKKREDAELQKITELCQKILPAPGVEAIETKYTQIPTPIFRLQKTAAKNYPGLLFKKAHFDAAGKLRFEGLIGDAKQAEKLHEDIVKELTTDKSRIAPRGIAKLELTPIPWVDVEQKAVRNFSDATEPLVRQTRIDSLSFEYDDKNTLRLVCRGVSVFRSARVSKDEQDAKLTEALKAYLKKQKLDDAPITLDIDRKVSNPAVELQKEVAAARLDGVLFRTTGFDDKGALRIQAFVPKGMDEQVRKLFDTLSKKYPTLRIEQTPWMGPGPRQSRRSMAGPIFVMFQDEKGKDAAVDWSKLLADVRANFAKSSEPALRQTRVDRAYFSLDPDEPDDPPTLNFAGVSLQTVHDDEAKTKKSLLAELGKVAVPGITFTPRADAIEFKESPIYGLQKAAVEQFKTDATFNHFFEQADYAADGVLQLHVLSLRQDDGKLAKLVANHPLPAELIGLPGGKDAKAPKIIRRDFDWASKLAELRKRFAGSPDPLLQRTRIDDGNLSYTDDRKGILFHVAGVCVHPPGLIAAADRAKQWTPTLKDLIPKITYTPAVAGIAMIPNPSIAWQDQAIGQESHDGIFFQLARFNAAGRLAAVVKLANAGQREDALKIVAQQPAPEKLRPVDDKSFEFQTWNWKDVLPKAQARLARGDFLEHRTRIDRVFLKYDDVPNGIPFIHFEGVSLHPTAVEKADALRKRLEESLEDLPPGTFEHKLNSKRIDFIESPIYALQAAAVAKSLDGLLFADGRYDAEGKLHLGIAVGTPDQREIARKLVEATPMPEGVARPKGTKPILDFTEIAWADVLHEMQRWLARSGESLLKKSRLDRAFFSYPPTREGPDLNMMVLGIFPKNDALTAQLKKRLDQYVRLTLADQLRAGPVAVRPMIENIANPATVVQAKVHELPILDGVRLDDASFDRDGKLVLHGIWNSKKQRDPLDKLIRIALAGSPALKHGINWNSIEEYDSASLLHAMRVWIAGQETIDEVWLERIYFDAAGKAHVVGFHTRPADKQNALKKLPEFLPRVGSKALPALEAPEPKAKPEPEKKKVAPVVFLQEPKDDDAFRFDKLPNIAQYLRDNIPKVAGCDGLRIDRCFYDPQGVFRIDGLADHAKQTAELKPFLDDEKAPFDRKRQLAKGWDEGRQTVIALRPMMVSLRENFPSLPEFDGFTLTRAHHDPKNQLVLTGSVIGDADPKEMAEIATRLLQTHPRWRLRTTFGVEVKILDRKKADRELAEKLTYKALHLLQVNIGEARVEPISPSCAGFLSHAWPFDPKLPRVRPTDHDYAQALEYLDAALLNDTKNNLAWYMRGYVLLARGRSDLTLRDYRRMTKIENDDAEARHHRILDLELVQGVYRQRASRIEQDALIDVGDGWTLRELRESPAVADDQGRKQ